VAIESAESRRLRGRAAIAKKLNRPNAEALRRDYAAERVCDYVCAVVDKAPPFTQGQKDRITMLLNKVEPTEQQSA
jgi:hypothetical protein